MEELDIRAYEVEYWEWKRKELAEKARENRSDKTRANEKRYRDSHKEQRYEYGKKHYEENKEKYAEWRKKYRLKREAEGTAPDRREYLRQYYLKNKEEILRKKRIREGRGV